MVVALDFMDGLNVVILILDFIMLYRLFYPSVVGSQILGIALSALVTFLLVVPNQWFMYIVFCALFLYSFFWNFRPGSW